MAKKKIGRPQTRLAKYPQQKRKMGEIVRYLIQCGTITNQAGLVPYFEVDKKTLSNWSTGAVPLSLMAKKTFEHTFGCRVEFWSDPDMPIEKAILHPPRLGQGVVPPEHLTAAAAYVPGLLWVWDAESLRYLFVTEASARVAGMSVEECLTKSFHDMAPLLPPEDLAVWNALIEEMRAGPDNESRTLQYQLRSQEDGYLHTYLAQVIAVTLAGQPRVIVGQSVDMSEDLTLVEMLKDATFAKQNREFAENAIAQTDRALEMFGNMYNALTKRRATAQTLTEEWKRRDMKT